jgi:hypothetical protein
MQYEVVIKTYEFYNSGAEELGERESRSVSESTNYTY